LKTEFEAMGMNYSEVIAKTPLPDNLIKIINIISMESLQALHFCETL